MKSENFERKAPYSIKRQLTLSVTILVSVLLMISLYFSFQSAKHEVEEVYDARLGQSAKLLLLAVSLSKNQNDIIDHRHQFDAWMDNIRQLAANDDEGTVYGHPYEQNLVFQFFSSGELLWSSIDDLPALSKSAQDSGFTDVDVKGEAWRTFQLTFINEQGISEYVVVAEKHAIRQEIINEIALATSIEQMFLLPALLAVLLWLIAKYLRPIDQLRTAIALRNAHHLDRIHVKDHTVELAPLVDALNTLLEELELAWEREKRFTRAAAHELKTPLTILRLNVENALATDEPEQKQQDLHNILLGIERTDRLIQQLLTLAKVETTSERAIDSVDLNVLLQRVIGDLAPLALKQNQDICLEGRCSKFLGDSALLEVLFRNLIDNAIRYSGSGSAIRVVLHEKNSVIEVQVSDNGPDIAPVTRERLFEAFYRGQSDRGDGAGLGMAICRDIATLHNASLELMPRSDENNTFVVRFSHSN
ncbi:histidine kinase [Vibrio galatheae]|uniref:histidine kinase n=1 Tax=Vibrio galatheae TaxID=579748 RepID=A0A0F4NLF1_9VIBR|nr:ATP-binding protein [Vibrio galatheae]KJY82876.1 histidine kinase [Vibrio galatheae]